MGRRAKSGLLRPSSLRMMGLPSLFLGLAIAAVYGCMPQRSTKLPTLGYIAISRGPLGEAFEAELAKFGWVDGRNITIARRYAEGDIQRYSSIIAELVALPVDAMILADSRMIPAARQATRTIPLIVPVYGDYVRTGLAESISQPGGNVTGLTNRQPQLNAKRLEVLRDAVPGITRVGVLWNNNESGLALQWPDMEEAASVLGIQLQSMEVSTPGDFAPAFRAAQREGLDAMIVVPDTLTSFNAREIAHLAKEAGVATIFGSRSEVEDGGLLGYGPNRESMFRRAAAYADKVLRGESPAVIPIEGPTKFDLILNLGTADALGLTLPSTILRNATEVIK